MGRILLRQRVGEGVPKNGGVFMITLPLGLRLSAHVSPQQ